MKRNQTLLGILLTLVGGCFWGLCGACAQYLFEREQVTSNFLVPWRMTLAGAILLIYHCCKSPKTFVSVWKKGSDALQLILYAIFGMAMCQYAYFATIELSNAGTATVLQYSAPAMLLILVCILDRKLPTGIEILAVLCASAGVFLLATHGNFGTLAISPETLVMGLIAALAVVAYNLLPRKLMQRFDTSYLLGWGMFLGGLMLMAVLRPWQYTVQITPTLLLCMAVIILLGTIGSFCLYMMGMKIIGPTKAALYACIEPVAAAVLAAVWLKVPFALLDLVGFVLILATTFILSVPDLKKAARHEAAGPS